MKYQAILFDLDGTLLPMDQDVFVKAYFSRLAKKLAPLGYEPEKLIQAIWAGTGAMVKNDGKRTNEEVFWETFTGIFGAESRKDEPTFADFYANEFQQVRESCGFTPKAKETIKAIKALGCRVILATNPIFPAIATESRMSWAGLDRSDFELYTTYENSSFSKPNPAYYQEILGKLGLEAGECLMVGNDVTEDGAAATLGMDVFFLPACLINKEGRDISACPQGDFDDLLAFIKQEN